MKKILLWDPRFPARAPDRLELADAVAAAAVRAGVAAAADPAEQGVLASGAALDPGTPTEVVIESGPLRRLLRLVLPASVAAIAVAASIAAATGLPIPGAPGGGDGAMPATQAVAFGAKTLVGHGGHTLGYNGSGTLAITAGNDSSHWQIIDNRLVPKNGAGAYGSAGPAFAGPYSLTIGDGQVSTIVTVTITANTAHVAVGSASNLDTTTSSQLRTVMLGVAIALGDTVLLRDGWYNPTSADFRIRARAGGYSGTGRITVRSENPDLSFDSAGHANLRHGARWGRLGWDAGVSGDVEFPFDVREVWFHDDTGGANGAYLHGFPGNGFGVSSYNCRYECGPGSAYPANTKGFALIGGLTSAPAAADNLFTNVMRGVVVGCSAGSGIATGCSVLRNNFVAMREDAIDFALNQVAGVIANDNFGLSWTFGTGGGHPDFIQSQGNTTGTSIVFGELRRNILYHAAPVTGTEIVQGLFNDDSTGASRFTNAIVENNIIITTAANGIALVLFDGPNVRFNTVIASLASGSIYSPAITVPAGKGGAGGTFTYNVANGFIFDGQTGSPTLANNVTLTKTLTAYQAAFANWTEVGLANRETVKAVARPKVDGTLKNTDGSYAGALKTDGSWNDTIADSIATVQRSIDFGPRNGEDGQSRWISGPAVTNLFGNGTAGGPGALMFRCHIDKSQMFATGVNYGGTGLSPFTLSSTVLATGTSTGQMSILFYGPGHSTVANRARFIATLKDNANTNTVVLTSGQWLDNDPALVVIRNDGTNFRLDLVKMDGTIIAGTPVATPAGWKGNSNVQAGAALGFGSYVAATTTTLNHMSGCLADYAQIRNVAPSDAEIVAIGKGRAIGDVISAANIARWYRMNGVADLAQTGGADAAAALTLNYRAGTDLTFQPGPSLCGSHDGAQGLILHPLGQGYVAGTPQDQPNATRPLPVSLTNTGTAPTHVQARLVRASDGGVVKNWTRITATPLAAGARLDGALPACPPSPWARIEIRREDNIEIITGGRRCAVGTKVWGLDGQSQEAIALMTRATAGAAVLDTALPGDSSNLSYVIARSSGYVRERVTSAILRSKGEAGVGMMWMAKRLAALQPNRVFQLVISPIVGTGRHEYYNDQVSHNATTAQKATPGDGGRPDLYPLGTEPYTLWGDDVTPGSGMVTDLLLAAGRDISFFMMMPSTDDYFDVKMPIRLNSLYFGGDRTGGGDGETGAPPRYFARPATGLVHPIHVAAQPHDRFISAPRTTSAVSIQQNKVRPGRAILRAWALGLTGGKSGSISHFAPDKMMGSAADEAHQTADDPKGNLRLGAHAAMGLLRTAGLSSYDPEVLPASIAINGARTRITLTIPLKNGGTLITGDGRAPGEIEYSVNGGTTPIAAATTSIIDAAAGKVAIDGDWTAVTDANIRVRYMNGGPCNRATGVASDPTAYAAETDDLNGLLYESRADVVGAPGVPVQPYSTETGWISL